MFCVSCLKIKMARTLSAGFSREWPHTLSGVAGGPLLEKLFKKRERESETLQPQVIGAKKLINVFFPKKILCIRDYVCR